jgi:hypothetical protein
MQANYLGGMQEPRLAEPERRLHVGKSRTLVRQA